MDMGIQSHPIHQSVTIFMKEKIINNITSKLELIKLIADMLTSIYESKLETDALVR